MAHRIILFLALFLLPLHPCFGSGITDSLKADDPRLQQSVTIQEDRIYVCELLEKLSDQTGIQIKADLDDGASDEKVLIAMKNVPVYAVMDGLYGLFSYRGATWHWERTNAGEGKYGYTLTRANARFFAQRIKEQVLTEIEETLEFSLANRGQDQASLAESAKSYPDLMFHLSEKSKMALEAVASLTTKEQRSRILRQEEELVVSVAELPAPAKAYIEFALDSFRRQNPHLTKEDIPDPKTVKILVGGRLEDITFDATLLAPNSVGGAPFIGSTSMEKRWQNNLQDLWLLRGDAPDNPDFEQKSTLDAKQSANKPIPSTKTQRKLFGPNDVQPEVKRVTGNLDIPVIAKLPVHTGSSSDPVACRILRDHLDNWEEARQIRHKWRNGILLLTFHGWVRSDSDETQIPFAVYQKIASDALQANDRLLPLEDLLLLADRLTPKQLAAWENEDSDFLHGTFVLGVVLENRMELAALFRSQKLREKAATKEGAPMSYFSKDMVKMFQAVVIEAGGKAEDARRFRFLSQDVPQRMPAYIPNSKNPQPEMLSFMERHITFQVLNSKGKVMAQRRAAYSSHIPR